MERMGELLGIWRYQSQRAEIAMAEAWLTSH